MEFTTLIGKKILLEKLKKNRKRYVDTRGVLIEVFKKKSEEYQKAYMEYSKKVVESSLAEDDERPHPPSIPANRTETYDMYIAMVDLHCVDTLEIDSVNFNRLFMDKWDFITKHIHAMTLWAGADASLAAAVTAYEG